MELIIQQISIIHSFTSDETRKYKPPLLVDQAVVLTSLIHLLTEVHATSKNNKEKHQSASVYFMPLNFLNEQETL